MKIPVAAVVLSLFAAIAIIFSCTSGNGISKDASAIQEGSDLFGKLCMGCHSFTSDGIGPHLAGLTQVVDADWIRTFIKNPRGMINASDDRATRLFEEYGTFMPGFHFLTYDQIGQLLAYMNTFEPLDYVPDNDAHLVQVQNPLPDTASNSGIILDIHPRWRIPASAENHPVKARINQMRCEPVSDRLFVSDLRGQIRELTRDSSHIYLDLSALLPRFIHTPGQGTGLGSFDFHPDYHANGLFYTTHCESPDSDAAPPPLVEALDSTDQHFLEYVLLEWKMDDPLDSIFRGTHRELLRMEMLTSRHGMQALSFNPTAVRGDADFGTLYLGIGDGGSVGEGFAKYAHHGGSRLWGTIVRINPTPDESDARAYSIPTDNPFVDDTARRAEIWAYGFRNPNQLHWDETGTLYATDIGHKQVEEVNRILPGRFYGWPIREGSFLFNYAGNQGRVYELPEDDERYNVTYPAHQIGREDVRAIIGGGVYQAAHLPQLFGNYLLGDIVSGELYMTDLQDELKKSQLYQWQVAYDNATSLQEICGSSRVDLRFGRDCEGHLYIMSKANGLIYQVIPQGAIQ